MEDSKLDKVIIALEALYDAMHKNQCYACSYELVEVAEEFGTEIVADALELLKDYKQHLQNDLETLKEEKRRLEFEHEVKASIYKEKEGLITIKIRNQ